MKKALLTTLMVIHSVCGFSQTVVNADKFKMAMTELNLAYMKSFPIKSTVQYAYYSDYKTNPEVKQSYTVYADSGGVQCMISDEIESFQYDTVKVLINHSEKMVAAEKRLSPPLSFPSDFLLDSLWKDISTIAITENSLNKTYTLQIRSALYSKLVISVNKANGLLSSVKMYVNPEESPDMPRAMIEVKISGVTKLDKFSVQSLLKDKVNIDSRGTVLLGKRINSYKLLTPKI
ncbi:MAG: hypothetical protein EP332_04705 [Bacteroidetes bacterium]|nr:MAG: hypothetical protein EP332_04705 [Bacteroidota bacterium]